MHADHFPRIDDVAAALRHLLPVYIEQHVIDDHVLVDRRIERRHADREQRVEPAAGLVDALADVIGREVRLEVRLMLERIMPLRIRHGATVEPDVNQIRFAKHFFS